MVKITCQTIVEQMQNLGSHLDPDSWNVLNGQVFIHCLSLPRFLRAEASADTMGM